MIHMTSTAREHNGTWSVACRCNALDVSGFRSVETARRAGDAHLAEANGRNQILADARAGGLTLSPADVVWHGDDRFTIDGMPASQWLAAMLSD